MGFLFGVLITNFMLVLIKNDVFMHLGLVGSGQVRSTSYIPKNYSYMINMHKNEKITDPRLVMKQ